jgi:hypothetical protein
MGSTQIMQKITNNADSITTECRQKAIEDITHSILCYPHSFYLVKIGLGLEKFPLPIISHVLSKAFSSPRFSDSF